MRLKERVAVVTGGASGMGRAMTVRFAEEGAHVVVADIDAVGAAETVELTADLPGTATAFEVDITDEDRLKELFDHVAGTHGRLNVLCNNAGDPGPAGLDIERAEWDATIGVNLQAGFYACAHAVPLLRESVPHASIVFTASVSGLVGSPLGVAYGAAKGGIVLVARSLAVQLGPQGIRVNAICPGPTDTPMLPRFFGRDDPGPEELQARIDGFLTQVPMGRLVDPREIANAALFFASDDSAFVSGVALPVDGALLA